MDSETKVTYSIIAGLIVFLGGLAYFLQPLGVDELKKTATTGVVTETEAKSLPTTPQSVQATPLPTQQVPTTMEDKKYTVAVITTNKGTFEITFGDKTPTTVLNFTKLAQANFYDGVRFHRVIKDFMIQTGDPLSKDVANQAAWGTGGPGYKFNDELKGDEQYSLGTVAMANSGPNTNGSQFFIVTGADGYNPPTPAYTVFGHVTKGLDVVKTIQNVPTTGQPYDRPLQEVVIEKVGVR